MDAVVILVSADGVFGMKGKRLGGLDGFIIDQRDRALTGERLFLNENGRSGNMRICVICCVCDDGLMRVRRSDTLRTRERLNK